MKIKTLLLILLLNFIGISLFAEKTPTISIINFPKLYDDETLNILNILNNELINALSNDNKCILVDRESIGKVLEEQNLSFNNVEPIVLGKLIGADFFICLSFEKKGGKGIIETVLLDVNSADILFSIKQKITGDDYSVIAKKIAAKIIKKLPEFEQQMADKKNTVSVSIIDVNNTSQSPRLDYLEDLLREKTEYIISSLEGFQLLRRSFAGIVRPEIDLSYSGWVRPSDKAVAKYSDVAISIEFKESHNNGVEFKKLPIELKVKLGGRKINLQEFTVRGSLDNLSDFFKNFQDELIKRISGLKKEDQKNTELTAREQEAQRLWERLKKKHKYITSVDTDFDENGKLNKETQEVISTLEKILLLNPGLREPRLALGEVCSEIVFLNTSPEDFEKSKLFSKKAANEFEFLLSHFSEDSISDYMRYAYDLNQLYCVFRIALSRKLKKVKSYSEKEILEKEIVEIDKKIYLLGREVYLAVPPEDITHCFLSTRIADYFFDMGDVEGAKQFFLLLDKIVGKKYFKKFPSNLFTGNCPLSIAVYAFGNHKKFKEAEFFLELCKKTQPELYERYGETLEEYLYRKSGNTEKLNRLKAKRKDADNIYRKSSRFADALMTSPVKFKQIPIPDKLFFHSDYYPANSSLLVYKEYKDCEIYIVGTGYQYSTRTDSGIAGFFQGLYKQYFVFILDKKSGTIRKINLSKTKEKKIERITDCEKIGDYIYFTTHQGLLRYDLNSKEEKWFTVQDGLPYNYLKKIVASDGLLWVVSVYYSDMVLKGYSVVSFNPEDNTIKTFFGDKEYNVWVKIIDFKKYKKEFYVISKNFLFFFDPEEKEWSLKANCHPTSMGTYYDNKIWIGAGEGLGYLNDDGFKKVFSSGVQQRRDLLFDNIRIMLVPLETPLVGEIQALAADNELIWVLTENSSQLLTAYNAKTDTWYGPFIVPDGAFKMDINSKGELLFYHDSYGMIRTADLLELARKNNLVRTSEEYRKMVKEKFRNSGTYGQAIYAILTNQPKDTVMNLLNMSIKENPFEYRAIFWKALYLEIRTYPETKEALEIYKSILKSDAYPEYIKNVAKMEKGNVEKFLKRIEKASRNPFIYHGD